MEPTPTQTVVHELNNLLTAIAGYARLTLERDDLPGPVRVDVFEIATAAERASELVRSLRTIPA